MLKTEYLKSAIGILEEIQAEEAEAVAKAAELCSDVIKNGGIVHFFGSGHSVIPVMDAFPPLWQLCRPASAHGSQAHVVYRGGSRRRP